VTSDGVLAGARRALFEIENCEGWVTRPDMIFLISARNALTDLIEKYSGGVE
jgi:hypothetical protein